MESSLQQKINNKYAVVKKFAACLRKIKTPMAFLVFGSVGRGRPAPDSDIDTMIVFRDSDLADFINNGFVSILPFDSAAPADFIKEADIRDLRSGRIDFLRLKGLSAGEKTEVQLFPMSAIRKAVSVFGGDLKGGTKSFNGNSKTPVIDRRPRPTLTFAGEIVFFQKNTRSINGGERLDFTEAGIKFAFSQWIRGLTLGKLIAPSVIIDSIGLNLFLDRVVLRGIIRSALYSGNFYVRGEDRRVVGIKEDALRPAILDRLLKSHKDGGTIYGFGEKERKRFNERFSGLLAAIILQNNYTVF